MDYGPAGIAVGGKFPSLLATMGARSLTPGPVQVSSVAGVEVYSSSKAPIQFLLSTACPLTK